MKKIIARTVFRKYPKIIIASSGRSGSSMLFNIISECLIAEVLKIKKKSKFRTLIKKQIMCWVDDIQTVRKTYYQVYKTHDVCDSEISLDCKYIFIYGDPLEAALSVEQVVSEKGIEWFNLHQSHLKGVGSYDDLYNKDVLNYEGQLKSWMSRSEENVLCVDYDDLWQKEEEISQFIGFKIVLPRKKKRSMKSGVRKNINRDFFSELIRLKENKNNTN